MPNHKKIQIEFNCNDVFDVLRKYPLPKDESADVSPCSDEEMKNISNILNLNLPITSILYFRMGRSFNGYIHKDKNLNNPKPSLLFHALNFPLHNCDNVYMRWYKQIDSSIDEKSFGGPSDGSPIPQLNYNNAICIDEVNCNQVNLVNVLDWHAIENRSTVEYGYLISVRFEPYIKTSFDKPLNEWWR